MIYRNNRDRYRKKSIAEQTVGRTRLQVWQLVHMLNKGHSEKVICQWYPKLTKADVKIVRDLYERKRAVVDHEIHRQTGGY